MILFCPHGLFLSHFNDLHEEHVNREEYDHRKGCREKHSGAYDKKLKNGHPRLINLKIINFNDNTSQIFNSATDKKIPIIPLISIPKIQPLPQR